MILVVWAAIMKLFLIIVQSQIFLTSESHNNDLQLPMLLTECTAVVLSFGWTGFYVIEASTMIELNVHRKALC